MNKSVILLTAGSDFPCGNLLKKCYRLTKPVKRDTLIKQIAKIVSYNASDSVREILEAPDRDSNKIHLHEIKEKELDSLKELFGKRIKDVRNSMVLSEISSLAEDINEYATEKKMDELADVSAILMKSVINLEIEKISSLLKEVDNFLHSYQTN